MKNPPRLWTPLSECVHMGHDIMSQEPLVMGRSVKINVIGCRAQSGQLSLTDIKAQFVLGLSQSDPEFPPGAVPRTWRKQGGSLTAAIAVDERVLVGIVCVHATL